MSVYGKGEDLAESQKEAFNKLERKVLEQGEIIREQSIRINELESLAKQRENELTHLKKNYELEIQRLNELVASLQKQSDEQSSKIREAEKRMKEEADNYRYKEEDLQVKIRNLERKIKDFEDNAKKSEERIKELNQQLEISAAKVSELERKLKDKEAEMSSIESMIMEDTNYKPYFIVKKFGSSTIQDIKKILGLQEGVARRIVLELEKKGLLKVIGERIRLA